MKICNKCLASKSIDEFEKGRARCRICRSTQNAEFYQKNKTKICIAKRHYTKQNKKTILIKKKEFYIKNKDSILAQKTIYYKDNRNQVLNRMSEYYDLNKEQIRIYRVEYCKRNSDKMSFQNAKRRAILIAACPKWLSNKDVRRIGAFYRLSKYLTTKTGINHEVDHIVPLKGKEVRGLHVPWNLQILTRRENRQKSNKVGTNA